MKVPLHHDSETVSMANPTNATRSGQPMDSRVRKNVSVSPGSRKKGGAASHRTFGVPLGELVARAPHGYTVPFIVKKICTYIEHHGLECEGIFRVNGSQRVVDQLRHSFELHGDAVLDDSVDVMAVAGLLKMFLRELPEAVVPESMTRKFVTIQEEHQRNAGECVSRLKAILRELPSEHYELLKHTVRFLAIVACNEHVNRMSPMALAIVFGPNLFRCGKGFLALKDQGTTNQIVFRFIVDYNSLFKDATEDPPAVYWERKKNNLVPPRPPPPKLHIEEVTITPEPEISVKPVPSPRKSKMKSYDSAGHGEHGEDQEGHSESSSSRGKNSQSLQSPSFSDDEMTGRLSPFHFDSDSGFSLMESPVPSARTSEFVDKAIKATVIGHLFGDESSLLNASIDTTIREDHSEPESQEVKAEVFNDLDRTPTETRVGVGVGVKDRARMFEGEDQLQPPEPTTRPAGKQRPNSKAFEMFENKGIIITQLPRSTSNHEEVEDLEEEEEEDDDDDELGSEGFEGVNRNTDTLYNFKKPAGPSNRRSPSRWLRQNSTEDADTHGDSGEQTIKDNHVIPNGHVPRDHSSVTSAMRHESDMNHNNAKTGIAFLDLPLAGQQNGGPLDSASPDTRSPAGVPKPFVPPLDFSTLHENVGGQDAILAHSAQSLAYQRAKQLPVPAVEEEDGENEDPSPRTNKTKRKAGTAMEEDDLPFSQVDQDQYKMHSHGSTDDELTARMKAQMRKIQSLKKKVKLFEEAFEHEHGYKPSHAEKASKPEVKKFLVELSRARKEAKRLKEEAEMGSRSRHGSGASSTGERTDPPDLPPSMSYTLDVILRRLKDKRKEAFRPEDIELMNSDQVQEEKLSIQKALLHFEGIHGRPKSRDEKDLMRPLYDRYRTIKRLLSRQPMSPRGNTDLPTVPEDQPMDIHKTADTMFPEPIKQEPIRVPTAPLDNYHHHNNPPDTTGGGGPAGGPGGGGADDEDPAGLGGPALGTLEFAVTRDLAILAKTRPTSVEDQGPHSPKSRRKLEMRENIENRNTDSNLHELSAPELQDQLIKARNSKKRLRKLLRDFEENFTRKTGRKVGREDRLPMQSEYTEYKQLKARLKLLEALLSKHAPSEV